MILVTIEIEVRGEDDAADVASNIKDNLRDALGHCPYNASLTYCDGEVVPDTEEEDDED